VPFLVSQPSRVLQLRCGPRSLLAVIYISSSTTDTWSVSHPSTPSSGTTSVHGVEILVCLLLGLRNKRPPVQTARCQALFRRVDLGRPHPVVHRAVFGLYTQSPYSISWGAACPCCDSDILQGCTCRVSFGALTTAPTINTTKSPIPLLNSSSSLYTIYSGIGDHFRLLELFDHDRYFKVVHIKI